VRSIDRARASCARPADRSSGRIARARPLRDVTRSASRAIGFAMSHLRGPRATGIAALLIAAPAPAAGPGWYLLVPPVVSRGQPVVDEAAPLSAWRPSPLYVSARECEEIRAKWIAARQRLKESVRRTRALAAVCIASTDPRLGALRTADAPQTGWYLLIAPSGPDAASAPAEPAAQPKSAAPPAAESTAQPKGGAPSAARANDAAPLDWWRHDRSFDTEAECERARQALQSPAEGGSQPARARCVGISDPALAPAATR